jgi:serine phosphatase RsbU (regulator of sigma subunit)
MDADSLLAEPSVSREAALQLAQHSDALIQRLDAAERTIRRQEAELASRLMPPLGKLASTQLGKKLEGALKEGAIAARCSASGLYLLNEDTSELKLRARYGIPRSRLMDAPRPLRGALGDLESLVSGMAVMERLTANPQWASPEPWEAGMCAPVAFDGFPIGTLWMWRSRSGRFGKAPQAAIRATADRVALLMQQSTARRAQQSSHAARQSIAQGATWQQQALPLNVALAPDWNAAGWSDGDSAMTGVWYTWDVLSDGSLGLTIAQGIGGKGIGNSMTGLLLKTAWQSHVGYRQSPSKVLQAVADTLWQSSSEVPKGNLAFARIQPETGEAEIAWFGNQPALIASRYGYRSVNQPHHSLGSYPDLKPQTSHFRIQPGECLMFATSGLMSEPGSKLAGRLNQQELANVVRQHLGESVDEILSAVRRRVAVKKKPVADRCLVVLKRKPTN